MDITNTLRHLRTHWRSFLLVHLLFTLLAIALLSPLLGLLLQGLLALSGNTAVADQDIALLLLSPLGLAGATLLIALWLAISGLEMGALLAVAVAARQDHQIAPFSALRCTLIHSLPLLRLTLEVTLRLLAWIIPAAALLAAIAWALLTDYDINYYLAQRPTEFYYAIAAALPLILCLLWLVGRSLLRWSLAVPLLMLGGANPAQVLHQSELLTRQQLTRVAGALLRWLLLALLLSLLPVLFLDLTVGLVTGSGGSSLARLAMGLGLVTFSWSLLNILVAALILGSLNLLLVDLYLSLGGQLHPQWLQRNLDDSRPANTPRRPSVLAALGLILLVAAGTGGWLLAGINTQDDVLVVAHRGAAGAAPENTLAAVRQALEDGADWVEIDVQETRDGEVIVVHDSDFMKLAGHPAKVWETDLETVRRLDVGSWFGPGFAGEQVPTLAEVLETVRGRARLVIELKYYGHDEQLEQRVVEQVEAAEMGDQVAIMSLKLPGVRKIRALRPDWQAGLLAATALGDLTKLDVDFLAVNGGMASAGFIRRAQAAGKTVFVWTINDAVSLSHWMSAGVDGIITDEPALARDILAQRAELSTPERLLLSASTLFGRPEIAGNYRDNSP